MGQVQPQPICCDAVCLLISSFPVQNHGSGAQKPWNELSDWHLGQTNICSIPEAVTCFLGCWYISENLLDAVTVTLVRVILFGMRQTAPALGVGLAACTKTSFHRSRTHALIGAYHSSICM